MLHSELFSEASQGVRSSGLLSTQTPTMVRADLGLGQLLARQGVMVARQGNVDVEHEGLSCSGAGPDEERRGDGDLTWVRLRGQGEAFLADLGADVHVIDIENDRLFVNGRNVLAFSDTLSRDIEPVPCGPVASVGLVQLLLSGSGQAALVTHGSPVALVVGDRPTYADPGAVVCWSAGVTVAFGAPTPNGSSTGRTFLGAGQLALTGDGVVMVQPAGDAGGPRRPGG